MDELPSQNQPSLVDVLYELVNGHGVPASRDEHRIFLPEGNLFLEPEVFNVRVYDNRASCQLDVRVYLPSGQIIIESFGAIGSDESDAILNGINYFARSSFHVLLAALLNDVDEDQVEIEKWIVGGKEKIIVMGPVVCKGILSSMPTNEWFTPLENHIRAHAPGEGIHWIRFFFGNPGPSTHMCEVLLDNHPWEDLQTSLHNLPWPISEHYYSIRLFLMLIDPFN